MLRFGADFEGLSQIYLAVTTESSILGLKIEKA
jgi:hypothetical protein